MNNENSKPLNEINNNELKDDTQKLLYDIIRENETMLQYLSQEYCLKIQLKEAINDIKNKEKVIVIIIENKSVIERFLYEKIMKFEDFKGLGRLYSIFYNIEEIYDFILEKMEEQKTTINIIEIKQEKSLMLSIEEKISGFKKAFTINIELIKKDRNKDELIDILYKELEKQRMKF